MQILVVTEFGVSIGKTSERLVVRGPRPRLELNEDGPQLLLPLDLSTAEVQLSPDDATNRGLKDAQEPKEAGSDGAQAAGPQQDPPEPKPARKAPKKGAILTEVPFFRLSEIVIASPGVILSTDVIEECCHRGIRMTFLAPTGKPYAMLTSPLLTATVITRRAQLEAYHDRRGLEFARAVVRGKLHNQANLLKYFGKYLKSTEDDAFGPIREIVGKLEAARREVERIDGATIDEARDGLIGIEGRAGRAYWEGVKLLLGDRVSFEGREHRGATDPVNAALNYGYGILYSQVWGAVMNAGLEPFAGFLHADRPGKPSLVLDLIEEFRQPIVDRAVIAFINKGSQLAMKDGLLQEESKRAIADKVLERLDSETTFRGKRYRLRSIVQLQARSVAMFLRGEGSYKPFSWQW